MLNRVLWYASFKDSKGTNDRWVGLRKWRKGSPALPSFLYFSMEEHGWDWQVMGVGQCKRNEPVLHCVEKRNVVRETNVNCAHLFDGHGLYRLGLACSSQQCPEITVPTGIAIL